MPRVHLSYIIGILAYLLAASGSVAYGDRETIISIRLPAIDPEAGFAICAGQYYFVDSLAKRIYVVDPKTGRIHLLRLSNTAAGSPEDIASDNRGNCWLSFSHPLALVSLRPRELMHAYRLPDGEDWFTGLAAARDGSVWYGLGRQSRIGRFSPGSGRGFETYNLPAAVPVSDGWALQHFPAVALPVSSPVPSSSDTSYFPLPVTGAIGTDRHDHAYFFSVPFNDQSYVGKVLQSRNDFESVTLSQAMLFAFIIMGDGTIIAATEPDILLINQAGAVQKIPLGHTQEHCRNRTRVQAGGINESGTIGYFVAPLEGKLYMVKTRGNGHNLSRVFAGTDCPAAALVQSDGKLVVFDPTSQMLTIVPEPKG